MATKKQAKAFVKTIEKAIDDSKTNKHCRECQVLIINGHFCHETGCPNAKKTWVPDRGEWVRFVECFYCGCDVEQGELCRCCPETGEEIEINEQEKN
jgi:hypothetical protein